METEIDTWEGRAGGGGGGQPKTGFVTGVEGRTKKRGGRVSKLVKTLEQGQLQGNKILSYFSATKFDMERGHPLAFSTICESGQKRGLECDILPGVKIGSASKKSRK